jgi:hypothetical protein
MSDRWTRDGVTGLGTSERFGPAVAVEWSSGPRMVPLTRCGQNARQLHL